MNDRQAATFLHAISNPQSAIVYGVISTFIPVFAIANAH
jgi:hypothetical protein